MRRDRIRAVLELAVALAAWIMLAACMVITIAYAYLLSPQTNGDPSGWVYAVMDWAVLALAVVISALVALCAVGECRRAIREFRGRG